MYSAAGSPTYNISKYLVILFCELLLYVDNNDILVSFGVESLFTVNYGRF